MRSAFLRFQAPYRPTAYFHFTPSLAPPIFGPEMAFSQFTLLFGYCAHAELCIAGITSVGSGFFSSLQMSFSSCSPTLLRADFSSLFWRFSKTMHRLGFPPFRIGTGNSTHAKVSRVFFMEAKKVIVACVENLGREFSRMLFCRWQISALWLWVVRPAILRQVESYRNAIETNQTGKARTLSAVFQLRDDSI